MSETTERRGRPMTDEAQGIEGGDVSETERERLLMLLDECWIPGDGGMLFDHHMAPKIVKRAIDILADAPTSDESAGKAQGIEVVAERVWCTDCEDVGYNMCREAGATEPVLIVRDTPEARNALGMDGGDET